MRTYVHATLLAVGLALAAAPSAEAVEFCLSFSNVGNIFRLELTPAGNAPLLTGRDRQFEERAAVGSLYVQPGGASARIGLSLHGGQVGSFWNIELNLGTLTGPFNIARSDATTTTGGTASVIACPPSADPAAGDAGGLPDGHTGK